MSEERNIFAALPDRMISRGQYTATTDELVAETGRSVDSVRHGLARLRAQARVFSPARSLHVFVPPEFRSWKAVPADWFIDDLMRHMQREYYVGLLSAASLHGASHQAPQVFQVVTERENDDRSFGRVRLRFYQSRYVPVTPTLGMNSHTGRFRVSTREATVADLVDRPRDVGGLSNVATILREIGELESDELARLSGLRPRAHARRLGWLLERFRTDVDPAGLRALAMASHGAPALLSAGGHKSGQVDASWGVLINTTVEPDV